MTSDTEVAARHIETVLAIPYLDVEAIRARRFKVALDCVRGAGATVMPALLERLGCEVVGDQHGAGRPLSARAGADPGEPSASSKRWCRRAGADIGFAVDPDVDRLALVSDEGRAIGEDYTLALAAKLVLRHRRGPVVTNLSTSLLVEDVAREAGVEAIRAPVGEVNVAVRMRDERCADRRRGEWRGDPARGASRAGCADRRGPASAIAGGGRAAAVGRSRGSLPSYVIVKDKLARPNASLDAVYGALRAAFPDAAADTQDGLRLAWADRWVHVRPSGTEPIVRVIAEAPDEAQARELVRRSREPLDALGAIAVG